MASPRTLNLRTIDLNLFVVLDAIYGEGSLTAAARRLGMSQPAVSHALSRLRHALGDALFCRSGAGVAPTPFTRNIITDVRRALAILEGRLQDHERFDPNSMTRTFRIGMRPGVEAIVIPPLIAALATGGQGISVHSVRVERRHLEGELARGAIDVALDIDLPVGVDIRRQTLASDKLMVAARRGHELLHGGLTLQDYLRADHILVSSRRRGAGLEDADLGRVGLTRSIKLRCHSYLSALQVVSETDLLFTAPSRNILIAGSMPDVRLYPAPFDTVPVNICLYHHASADDDPASIWLRAALAGIDIQSPDRP